MQLIIVLVVLAVLLGVFVSDVLGLVVGLIAVGFLLKLMLQGKPGTIE